MKALIFSDAHLCPQNHEVGQKLLDLVLDQAKKHKVDYIFNLGDTFHYKNDIFVNTMDQYTSFLKSASKNHKVIQVVGNHDYGREYDKHALQVYENMENVVTVNGHYKLNDNIGFMSFARDNAKFKKEFKCICECKYVFGHFDINGFNLGSGWEEQHSYNDGSIFKNQDKVFSGHYHLAQTKKIKGTEITYVGTGYTTSFGETDQDKRIILLDLDTGEWESIDTGMTLHKTLKINQNEEFPEIPENEIEKGVKYRVVVEGPREYLESIKKPKNYPARIEKKPLKEKNSQRLEVDQNMSTKELLEKYVKKETKRLDSNIDINKTIEVGMKYLGDSNED